MKITAGQIQKWEKEIAGGKRINEISKREGIEWKELMRAIRNQHKGEYKILSPKKREKIIQEYHNGKEFYQLAVKFGVSIATIHKILKSTIRNRNRKRLFEFKTKLNKLPEWELGYIGGIIDGEGAVMIIKENGRYRYRLSITNRDKEIMEFLFNRFNYFRKFNTLHHFLGDMGMKCKKYPKNEYFEIGIADKKILKILYEKIINYSVGKKEELQICLDGLNGLKSDEDAFAELKKVKMKTSSHVHL
jgi:hypothetical protein